MNVPAVILPGVKSVKLAEDVLHHMMKLANETQAPEFGNFREKFKGFVFPKIVGLKMEDFSDGEFAPVIQETVRDRRVFILQHVQTSEEFMKLCFTIDAVKRCSGEKAVVILPYYPFSRQDKTMDKRTAMGAKVVAKMLEAVGADSVICFDLHAPQIAGFFDHAPVDMISGHVLFCDYIQTLNLDMSKVKFIAPDAGGAKRTKKFRARFPGSGFAVIDKDRVEANVVGGMELIGEVDGYDCILTDDIGDTFGTVMKATQLLYEKGAKSVRAILTHPVMSGKAYENLEKSGITELIVSDSIPLKKTDPRITVVSIAPSLASAMLRLGSSQSLSELNR